MTIAPVPEPDLAAIAESVLSEVSSELALGDANLPQTVRDAASDFRVAISDQIAAGRQYGRDLAELNTKRDLIPGPGFERLRTEAQIEARSRASEADRRAERAFDTLKAELTEAALPRVDASREALARQEFEAALRGADGLNRVIDLAHRGSYEAAAVLFTEFGRTVLEAAGMPGAELEETLRSARTLAADAAAKRGRTPRELLAGAALGQVAQLGAARFAARTYLGNALEP